jgi:acetate kinase
LRKYIGAYLAELGGADALVFTGGIGENSAEVRARACAGLEPLGICIDLDANAAASSAERRISKDGSPTQILVIPTNEELQIARETLEAVS